MLIIELLTAIVVALCSIYIYCKFVLFNFWRKKGVFYIEPVVPTGNVASVLRGKKSIGILFRDVYLKYKDHRAIGIYTFFKPNLVIADLDLVRIVLTKEFHSFHDRGIYCNEKIDPLSGHLFLLPGKKWRNLRVKMTPIFTSGKLKQMFGVLKECGEELGKSLEKIANTGECIEIKEIFARYTTDVIMSAAFGIKSNCMETPDSEFRYWGKKVFEQNALKNVIFRFIPQVAELFSMPIVNQGTSNFFINTFRDTVQYRQTHNVERHDFMNLLIQLMEKGYVVPDKEGDTPNASPVTSKISMLEAAAQAFVFFIAGFETSSTTATFCLYELALHQDIQNKLRQEIDEVLKKHGEVSYNAVNDMTYLHKVINETLRKYPPVPILNRICTETIDLTPNIHIPKGTLITIPVLGIQYDPAIYPDPNKFDPERFNADETAARHPYAYLPFGEGPRVCIGQRFGYMQTKVGIVNILSKFKVKLHPRTAVPLIIDKISTVLTPKGGVHLIIEPR